MIDWNKPVQTRDGRKVRVVCTDVRHPAYPILALVTHYAGHEESTGYTQEGFYYSHKNETPSDLVNVPQRHVHADLIIAWANGATIEYRVNREVWQPIITPTWAKDVEYRIKPE
jgi:hypothetical protein